MNYYYLNQQHKLKNVFIISNYVMQLDISATALAIYFYLMYIEDRKTYQCYPSYKTIGKALKIKSKGTVAKYVRELEDKCLIYTEPTEVILKDGKKRNGEARDFKRSRIKLGALFAPSRITSPCEARRRVSKMHLLVLVWC